MQKKLIILLLLFTLVFSHNSFAQYDQHINMAEHDLKPYYFGLSFGYNSSAYRISHTQKFASSDSFQNIQAQWGPGFSVGLMGSLKLHKFVDLRFVPTLVFSNKPIALTTWDTHEVKQTESIYFHAPLQLKFKADRIQNFRFYAIAGGKFDYDMSANSKSRRSDEFLKVRPFDIGAELGVGFEFYFPNFILAPEIKISQGFLDTHFKDSDIPLSNQIDKMNTRMFMVSLHIQG